MTTAEKLTTIAENMPKVYEAGKKAEYDAFWDAFQQNGERTSYSHAFRGQFWNEKTFKPKYPMVIKEAYYGFDNFNCDTLHTNKNKRMDMSKFEMDFSAVTDARYMFQNARVENLFCDLRNATTMQNAFASTFNGTIENITLRVSGDCTNYTNAFANQDLTKTIIFTDDSIINANINFAASDSLSRASIESIINALSETATGKTCTLSIVAVYDNTFGEDSEEWAALVATKPNWTISLL